MRRQSYGLDDLVRVGTLTPGSAQLVDAVVRARLAYVVTGGTGSGKTTLLAALLARHRPDCVAVESIFYSVAGISWKRARN